MCADSGPAGLTLDLDGSRGPGRVWKVKGNDMSVQDEEREAEAPSRSGSSRAGGRRRSSFRRRRRSRIVRVILAVVLVVMLALCWSVGSALSAPGNDSVAAKLAEWARDLHLGAVVGWLETEQYDLHPPQEGGTAVVPNVGAIPGAATPSAPASKGAAAALAPIVPPTVASPAGANLPEEGAWQVIGSVKGTPGMYATFVRPDTTHTSYLAGIVSMDPRLMTFQMHPGELDPGPGAWGSPTYIPAADRANLLATFNGGFKIKDSRGGYFLNGQTSGTLTAGAASVVFYKDGHIAVGSWGQSVSMTSDVVGVRQNLKLVIDGGAISPNIDRNVEADWGASIGGDLYVWRSGLGVTKDGRIVFVYGPALSVHSLSDLMLRAGVVTGLQMEINPAWMSFMYYQRTADPTAPTPVKLLSSQERPADRYLEPTSRDFIAVTAK